MSFSPEKKNLLIIGTAIFFLLLACQLFYLQIIDNSYKISAENNALRYITRYPVRGLILDRYGKVLVGNKNSYDIMVTPYDVKSFDTTELCKIFNLNPEDVRNTFKYYRQYRSKIGYQSQTFLKQVSSEQYSYFIEKNNKFPGFYGIPRTSRSYPYNAGGNLIGYVTEVDPNFLKRNPDYQQGDYTGRTGIEESCEVILKGKKGYSIFLRDANNKIQSSYKGGEYDTPSVPGKDVTSTIDAELQNYGESLMKNKVGALVAIEPSTGEILSLVSSPGIDVSILSEINKHYGEIAQDPFKPMFNRAVMSPQPPGSVFKLVNALIGLQEGVVNENTSFSCRNGYHSQGLTVGCHQHPSPLKFEEAIMMSCNSYFCNLMRAVLDNRNYPNIESSFNKWRQYVTSFGFGTKLGSDFPSEQAGIVPTTSTYDKIHGKGRWKSISIISLAIGQGELGCTPLHLANLAATIANRGFYHIPHIIKNFDSDSLRRRYEQKHYTLIDSANFIPVIEGMYRAVNSPPGSGATARIAAIDSLDVCGKTGTAENPHGDEHSVFMCFAPKDKPQIAIAVYVENAGFGATWAAPIASLMVEKYLNRGISEKRKYIEERLINANLLNKVPAWKKKQETKK